jgi:hypothetical protein
MSEIIADHIRIVQKFNIAIRTHKKTGKFSIPRLKSHIDNHLCIHINSFGDCHVGYIAGYIS